MKTLYLLLIKTPFKMKIIMTLGLVLNKLGGFYKFFLISVTTSFIQPLFTSLSKYLTPNFDYWAIAIIMMAIDTACGFYAHSGWWEKNAPNNLNPDEFFYKVFRKVAACASFIMLIGVVENHNVNLSMFTDMFSISIMISWLGWSILGSVHVFTGGKFPPKKIMDFFKKQNEDE